MPRIRSLNCWVVMGRARLHEPNVVSHPLAVCYPISCGAPYSTMPRRHRIKCDTPSLAEPLCHDRPSWQARRRYSTDSLQCPEKHSATGLLLHLSRGRRPNLAWPTKHPAELITCQPSQRSPCKHGCVESLSDANGGSTSADKVNHRVLQRAPAR